MTSMTVHDYLEELLEARVGLEGLSKPVILHPQGIHLPLQPNILITDIYQCKILQPHIFRDVDGAGEELLKGGDDLDDELFKGVPSLFSA